MGILSKLFGSDRGSVERVPFGVKLASILFAGKRADYYLYLADMIEGTRGAVSLKHILSSDAKRYAGTPRGTLTKYWCDRFMEGGSLKRTFSGTLPNEDIAIMDMLQSLGVEGALEEGLRDMARNRQLISKAKGTIYTTLCASVISMMLLLLLIFAMPSYTTPKVAEAFSILPSEYYPPTAVALFEFSDFVTAHWFKITVGIGVLICFVLWSFTYLAGPLRNVLDKYGIVWAIHRDFESISFLSNLAAVIKKRGNTSNRLKDALLMQHGSANKWKRYHIDKMVEMIDGGDTGPILFTTGMLSQETQWYIADLIESRGLDDALQFVRTRLEERALKKILLQSTAFSWFLMILSIVVAGYIMFWHIEVIDDMRSALQNFLS